MKRLSILFLAAAFGMLGIQAWAQSLSTTEIDGTTYYEIGNATELVTFATVVNDGEYSANALLTADIDMTDADISVFPIGGADNSTRYIGTFDGQGHKISNFKLVNPDAPNNYGMFNTYTGVVLKNFWLDPTCEIEGTHTVSLIGRHDGGGTFEGIGNCANVTGIYDNVGGLFGAVMGVSNDKKNVLIKNCWTTGTVLTTSPEISKGTDCGALTGWFNNTKVTIDNFWTIADVVNPNSQAKYVFRNGAGATFTYKNCFSKNGTQPSFAKVSGDLASGELCYMLNDNLEEPLWFQTLGTDASPVPYSGHAIVYMTGRQHCNGDAYEDASAFSNSNGSVEKDDHSFADGTCTYCGFPDESYMTANAEGIYEIGTPMQLKWFAAMVNIGHGEFNARLTADINLADVAWTPIGTGENPFKGIFEGQGHAITNFSYTATGKFNGLFGYIIDATVKDFSISGELTSNFAQNGVIGQADGAAVVSGIHSMLNIKVYDCSSHSGGVIGGSGGNVQHTLLLENCTFSGTLTHSGAGDCQAGIIGYTYNGTIRNCLFDGTIIGETNTKYGGILGYCKVPSFGGVQNCLSVGKIAAEYSENAAAIVAVWNGDATKNIKNNYYYLAVGSSANVVAVGTNPDKVEAPHEVTGEQLASGEVAWKLNNKTFIDVVWHQNIDKDDYPMLQDSDGITYETADGYSSFSMSDPESFETFCYDMISKESNFITETIANQTLLNDYETAVSSWENIDNFDDFREAYLASLDIKNSVLQSAACYANYIKACEDAGKYIEENGIEGTMAEILTTYLEDDVEPGENFPNGSYYYILSNCELNDEEIVAEIAFVNQMLESAISGGITPGTLVTRLLANANFAAGFEGWTREANGPSLAHGGVADVMPTARGLGKGSFSVSQSLTELPNGIYLMTANSMFRSGEDYTTQFYAGQLYLNNTVNYVMSPSEDLIPIDLAIDKENSLLSDDIHYSTDEMEGYVPGSLSGCSYAFNAGRYLNYCATEVTDGNLTVGVRSLGTGLKNDWLTFGNIQVIYLGTADQANNKLADVLEGYVARAQVILDYFWSEDANTYSQRPNMSEDLKDQLTTAIDNAASASTGEQKMALINTFSELFNEVHACRTAYVKMLGNVHYLIDYIDKLYENGYITEEDYEYWQNEAMTAWDYYTGGTLSTEEALDVADRLGTPDLVIPAVNGVFQLSDAEQVKLFSTIVGYGMNSAKAALTEDIDMSGIEDFEPIGSEQTPFSGEFDGQGHKVTNFTMTDVSGNRLGFFGFIKNATVQNFSISGSISCLSGSTGVGAIGWSEGSTLINIHSSLDIATTETDIHHVGGVCGSFRSGTKGFRCSFSGTITDTGGNHDCFGGIGGYSNGNCLYENCANYGDISFTAKNCYAGGICGYVNNDDFTGIKNCLNTGSVKIAGNEAPQYSGSILGRCAKHANSVFLNNYWLENSAVQEFGQATDVSATAVTDWQLLCGEVCFALNSGQEDIAWYQTLNEDIYPVLDFNHYEVLYSEANDYYYNLVNGEVGIQNVEEPKAQGAIFDLSGKRIILPEGKKLQRGIYIMEGKKILVK